jgi:peptide/nickel transport system ATP-binding protein
MDNLLRVEDLRVCFILKEGVVRAVDGVSLSLRKGETLTLIGESGSGKSVLGMAILRLLPENAIIEGKILFNGLNLLEMEEEDVTKIRGKEIAWIPQNPATSLNPVMKVGSQIAEPMELHLKLNKKHSFRKTVELLKIFRILPPDVRILQYPHQYSGGMKQRALIAMGTSANPRLIIADEPTKGVDAIRRAQVASVFKKIKKESDEITFLIITHDLNFAEKLADRVAVMYCGRIIEVAEVRDFFNKPLHPYSIALLNSLPSRGLIPIAGPPPSMIKPPDGCRFRLRCRFASDKCSVEPPLLESERSLVRCWLYV